MANFSAGDLVLAIPKLGRTPTKPNKRFNGTTTYKISDSKDPKDWEKDIPIKTKMKGLVVTRFVDNNDYVWYDVLFPDRERPSRVRGLNLMRLTDEVA